MNTNRPRPTYEPPIFILSTARSGSTLLRRLLDAHPQIAAPPEVNLVGVFEAIHFAAAAVTSTDREACEFADPLCREAAAGTIGVVAQDAGKNRWCEKSILSLDNPGLLLHVYPDAQFICLYRQCTDVIVSAIEASPWGYGGAGLAGNYGFEEYVARSPGNFVFALAAYWADKTGEALAFEDAHPEQTFRLRYEDLVADTGGALGELLSWLRVDAAETLVPGDVLGLEPALENPGDYKIHYTSQVNRSSVGRGWVVPVDLLHANLKDRIDRMQEELGYPKLGSVHPGSSYALPEEGASSRTSLSAHPLYARLASGLGKTQELRRHTARIVVVGEESPWRVDFARKIVERSLAPADCTFLVDDVTLARLAAGHNLGVALRQGLIKFTSDRLDWSEMHQLTEVIVSLISSDGHAANEALSEPASDPPWGAVAASGAST